MKLSQMKLSFSLCASLIGFGVIPSSVSLTPVRLDAADKRDD
jgi:hypothetical protein